MIKNVVDAVYENTVYEENEKFIFEPVPGKSKRSSRNLYAAAVSVNLISFATGIACAWTSPVFPKLTSTNDENPLGRILTPKEESWIAGLLSLGAIAGPLLAGFLSEKIGRKRTLLVVAIPMIISHALAAFATSPAEFYLVRFLMGITVGSTLTVVPVYVAEIAQDHNRGVLGCALGLFITFGCLFDFIIGPFVSIQVFNIACLLPSVAFLVIFGVFMPESPSYLVLAGRSDKAEESLKFLRQCSSVEVDKEMIDLIRNSSNMENKSGSFREILKSRTLLKGLFICLGIMIMQQMTGISVIVGFLHPIFQATGSKISGEIAGIVIGIIQSLTVVGASITIEKLGRKFLLIVSAIGASFSLIGLGGYFYFKLNNFNVDAIFWLPILSYVFFIIFFNVGLGPVPWAVMAEIFPSNVKSIAATLSSMSCSLSAFCITYIYPLLSHYLGMAETFWFFANFSFLTALFVYFVLPETKGRSAEEIQFVLSHKK